MSVGIECPVCEAVFRIKQVSSKTGIRCPECDRKFRYSDDVLAEKQTTQKITDPKKAAPKKIGNHATQTKSAAVGSAKRNQNKRNQNDPTKPPQLTAPTATQPPPQANTASQSDIAVDPHSSPDQPSQSSGTIEVGENSTSKMTLIQARKRQKARRQTIRAITTIVILSITILALGGLLYRQLYHPPTIETVTQTNGSKTNIKTIKPSDHSLEPSETQWNEPADDQSSGNDEVESDDLDEDEKQIELPRVSASDLPKREFEHLQPHAMQSVWQRIRPRLVSLDVRTDLGTSPSVGTIVDSRGWALTSNQMVGKWPDVIATASARDIDDYYVHIDAKKENDQSSLLTDISKGIAGAAPKRDHALIELNSRFVVALDTLEFATRLDVVAGMYLIQAAPPSPTNPYGYEEIKVHGRQEFEELETEARNKATALKIDDPLANWLVTSQKSAPAIGTPVLTRAGKMAGTYAFSTKQFAYFLMVDRTKNLVAQAAASSADGGKPKIVDATIDLLSPDHTMARPSQLMNRAGIACESFGWIPTDADQYLQLQKFSRRFSTVAKFVQDQQDDASESASLSILSDQTTRWRRSISTSIRDTNKVNPEKTKRLNALAVDKLLARSPNNANTYVPFVAEVYKVGFDLTSNEDSMLMTIGEDQTAVIKVPYSAESGPMRPGSKWLCFYKRPRDLNHRYLKLNSGEDAPAFSNGHLLLVLGPIQRR